MYSLTEGLCSGELITSCSESEASPKEDSSSGIQWQQMPQLLKIFSNGPERLDEKEEPALLLETSWGGRGETDEQLLVSEKKGRSDLYRNRFLSFHISR